MIETAIVTCDICTQELNERNLLYSTFEAHYHKGQEDTLHLEIDVCEQCATEEYFQVQAMWEMFCNSLIKMRESAETGLLYIANDNKYGHYPEDSEDG